jgi:hypothetical protein
MTRTAVRLCGMLLALLPVWACTPTPLPDSARMPGVAIGGAPIISPEGAVQLASYALGSPSRTRNNPVEAARAVASVDYLAGDFYANPHWDGMSPLVKQQMLIGRQEARAALGIAPDARSQDVVDGLIAASNAVGNPAAVRTALSSPVFTRGPDATLLALNNLPYLPSANWAAQQANLQLLPRNGNCSIFPCY